MRWFGRPSRHEAAIPGTGCWFDASNWLTKIVSLLAVVGLLFAYNAPAADAHYLPAGAITNVDSNGSCVFVAQYGSFGSNGYANITTQEGSSGCDARSAVTVTTAHAGHTHTRQCSFYDAADGNPGCSLTLNPLSVMATVHGEAFTMRVYTCNVNSVICIDRGHGAFG